MPDEPVYDALEFDDPVINAHGFRVIAVNEIAHRTLLRKELSPPTRRRWGRLIETPGLDFWCLRVGDGSLLYALEDEPDLDHAQAFTRGFYYAKERTER